MVNDHLSDFVTRIRNGYGAGLTQVMLPSTKSVKKLAEVLASEGFVDKVELKNKILTVDLKYAGNEPALAGIKRVSKSGARIYKGVKNFPKVLGGLGINIISTPKGIVSEKQAKKLNAGGEIIVQVW
jgi:small subunit ribosomal protein S8